MKRLIQIAFVAGCLSIPALAQWSNKNFQAAFCGTLAASCASPSFTNALTNPSIITVSCRGDYGKSVTVGDSCGNTYVDSGAGQVQTFSNSISGDGLQVFVAYNTTTCASNVVTCNFSPDSENSGVQAGEYTISGLNGLHIDGSPGYSTVSAVSMPSCSANALVFPSFTTLKNGDLIFASSLGGNTGSDGQTAGTSPLTFTIYSLPPSTYDEWAVQSSAGSTVATYGCTSSSSTWGGIAVAFSASSASPTGKVGILPPMMGR